MDIEQLELDKTRTEKDMKFNIISLLVNNSSSLVAPDINTIIKDAKKIHKWISEK